MKRVLVLSSQAFSLLHFRADMLVAMRDIGYEVHAAAPDTEDHWKDDLSKLGVQYHLIEMERTGYNPLHDVKGCFSIIKVINKIKPDIVFCYQAKTVIYGLIAAWICRVPKRFALIAGLGSAFRNTSEGIKARVLKTVLCMEYKVALSKARKVFFQNKDDSYEFIKARLVKEKKIDYMNGSGVNTNVFRQAPLPDENSFLIISRLIRDKGIIEFLEAARSVKKRYPNARFRIIGYYDQNPSALQPSDLDPYFSSGVAEFLGKQDDVYPYICNSKVYVLPSYHEGTPKSVLEAMSVGRPILTTDAPGCRETVIEGENGFLVPIQNAQALSDRMIWCIEHPAEMQKFAIRSRQIVDEKFDVRKVNQSLLYSMEMT